MILEALLTAYRTHPGVAAAYVTCFHQHIMPVARTSPSPCCWWRPTQGLPVPNLQRTRRLWLEVGIDGRLQLLDIEARSTHVLDILCSHNHSSKVLLLTLPHLRSPTPKARLAVRTPVTPSPSLRHVPTIFRALPLPKVVTVESRWPDSLGLSEPVGVSTVCSPPALVASSQNTTRCCVNIPTYA